MRKRTIEHLRSRGDFDRVFSIGRAVAAPLLVLRFAPRPSSDVARVGFAVGRRLGSAVFRNRVRRRWREVVRLGPVVGRGWDVVVVVRVGSAGASPAALREAWVHALRRSGLAVTPQGVEGQGG